MMSFVINGVILTLSLYLFGIHIVEHISMMVIDAYILIGFSNPLVRTG